MSTARRAAGPCPPSARATSAAIRSKARAGATPRARCSWARSSRRTSVKVVAISSSAAQGARSAPRARSASWATSSRTAVKAAESASAGADRGSRRGRARESSVASPSTRPQPFPFPCNSTCAPAGFCVSIRAESARLAVTASSSTSSENGPLSRCSTSAPRGRDPESSGTARNAGYRSSASWGKYSNCSVKRASSTVTGRIASTQVPVMPCPTFMRTSPITSRP